MDTFFCPIVVWNIIFHRTVSLAVKSLGGRGERKSGKGRQRKIRREGGREAREGGGDEGEVESLLVSLSDLLYGLYEAETSTINLSVRNFIS